MISPTSLLVKEKIKRCGERLKLITMNSFTNSAIVNAPTQMNHAPIEQSVGPHAELLRALNRVLVLSVDAFFKDLQIKRRLRNALVHNPVT